MKALYAPAFLAGIAISFFIMPTQAQTSSEMSPVFLVPGEAFLEQHFNDGDTAYVENILQPAQSTRWRIEEGVLVGYPSPKEFQDKKESHDGSIPIIDIRLFPDHQNVIAKFDFKFTESIRIEFGHKVTSLDFRKETVTLSAGAAKVNTGVAVEKNRWYSLVGELNGDELVITIEGVGSMHIHDQSIGEKNKGSIRIRGESPVYLDNIVAYEVKGISEGWEARKQEILSQNQKEK